MNDTFQMGDLPDFNELGSGYNKKSMTNSPYLNPEKFMVDEDVIDRDYTYMRKICPALASQIADWIEEECDRQEYEGSFLYDEYPDKTTLLKMTNRIVNMLPPGLSVTPKDLVHTMLCAEILYRRCRYYRKKKLFQ